LLDRTTHLQLQAEIKIHRTLKHEHICEFKHFFEDRDNCYILLELCHNQSMNEMIKRRKRLTEPEAAYFMSQLLLAVKFMHANIVIHRDLKLGNLFLDRNLHIKVGDFGLATRLEDPEEKRKTICGTPNYIAPEVIQGDKEKRGHSFEVDVWSMGVILYTLLIGKPPYEAKDVKATYQRILNNEYSFPPEIPISDLARHLIRTMLQTQPSDRPSLEEIGLHPFLAQTLLPQSLPSSATHIAPVWCVSADGRFLDAEPTQSVRGSKNFVTGTHDNIKRADSRDANTYQRQPLTVRNPNTQPSNISKPAGAPSANVLTSNVSAKKERSTRDVIDVPGIIKKGAALALGCKKQGTLPLQSNSLKSNTPGFQIFDENCQSRAVPEMLVDSEISLQPASNPRRVPPRDPSTHSQSSTASTTNTSALGVGSSQSPDKMPFTISSRAESDTETLFGMIERLETVLDICDARKGCYRPHTPRSISTNPSLGPCKWVTRYVDYTSKYGFGFLLNEGSSGVYFNDSTKIALAGGTNKFQYVERALVSPGSIQQGSGVHNRRGESIVVCTLQEYPEHLKKKVTLLKHFRNYLLEQQKKAEDAGDCELLSPSASNSSVSQFVCVKKWMRTKHAILFRLSDLTIQMVFYDQTEVLLTPDFRCVTYVDKNRVRSTYDFNDELVGGYAELQKRLKYTKDIMCQMVYGNSATLGPSGEC
jgi:polo-like kinase 1